MVEVEQLRRSDGQRLQCRHLAHPTANRDRTRPQVEPRLGDRVVGVDRDRDAGLLQNRGVLFEQADGLGLAAGAVDERE